MTAAIFDATTIDIKAGRFTFRATGSVQKFDGFLKVYQEGRDEKAEAGSEDSDEDLSLPKVEKGEQLKIKSNHARTAFYRTAAALFGSDSG